MVSTRRQISTDRLQVGEELAAPRFLQSADGNHKLVMQHDGNLVIYTRAGKATWSTGTWSLPTGQRPVKALLKRGGSLVLIDSSGVERWTSKSDTAGVDKVVLGDDGVLVVYAGSRRVWASAGLRPSPIIPKLPRFPIGPILEIPRPPIGQIQSPGSASRDVVINGYGRMAPVENSTVKIADGPSADIDANGVSYRIKQERHQKVRDVVEQAYLKDIASMGVWPGQVIQGNALKNGGVAAIGPFDRVPGSINISTELITTTPGVQHADIQQPSAATVNQARRTILNAINPTDAAGSVKSSFERASTVKEFGVNAGLNVTGSAFFVDANMSLNQTFEQSCVMGVIRQVYYSVSFEQSAAGSNGFWPTSVLTTDLSAYMGPGNPPLYISSVQYGRLICVLAKGKFSSSELKASLEARYGGPEKIEATADTRLQYVLSESDVTIYTLGVPGYANFQKLSDPIPELDRVYNSGLAFSLQNPGAPISFTAKHIVDNTDAHVSLAAQYMEVLSAVGADVGPTSFSVWDGAGGGTVDTKISVNPGDTVTVNARGKIWSGVAFSGTHGPEGWPGHTPDPAAPHPQGSNAYSFIISIGGREWIEAKTFWSGKPPAGSSGRLLLGINDNNPYNGNPEEKWTATVTVKRGNAESAGIYI